MLLSALLFTPFIGIIYIFSYKTYDLNEDSKILKIFALTISMIDLVISLII